LPALVINLFAGPGAGKSTMRASIFAELKWRGINCEEAPEFAKDLTWEERFKVLSNNQDYVFGKQLHRIIRLVDKVDVVITDSPILFSIIYDSKNDDNFRRHVYRKFIEFNNMNYFIERRKGYNPSGRSQTEEQAVEIDQQVRNFLNEWYIDYRIIPGIRESVNLVVDDIIQKLDMGE
jgi:hypothetical protein